MSGRSSQKHHGDSENDETEMEGEEIYSEEFRRCVAHFNQHAAEIAESIDEIISVGCEVMDNAKRAFVERMESVKQELLGGVQSQNAQWEETSKKAQDDLERLMSIKDLVKSLGLSA